MQIQTEIKNAEKAMSVSNKTDYRNCCFFMKRDTETERYLRSIRKDFKNIINKFDLMAM